MQYSCVSQSDGLHAYLHLCLCSGVGGVRGGRWVGGCSVHACICSSSVINMYMWVMNVRHLHGRDVSSFSTALWSAS